MNYWNKWTFPRHSNLLRCTCIYIIYMNDYLHENLLFYTFPYVEHFEIGQIVKMLSLLLLLVFICYRTPRTAWRENLTYWEWTVNNSWEHFSSSHAKDICLVSDANHWFGVTRRTFVWCPKLICWFGDAAWVCMWWLSVVSKSVLSTCCTDDTMMLVLSMSVLCSLGFGEHAVLVCGLLCPCGVLLLSVYTHITLSPELLKSHGMGLLMREDKNSETRGCDLPSSIFTVCHNTEQQQAGIRLC